MVQSFDLLMRLKMEFCVGTFNSPFASRLAQIAKKIEFNRGRWLVFFFTSLRGKFTFHNYTNQETFHEGCDDKTKHHGSPKYLKIPTHRLQWTNIPFRVVNRRNTQSEGSHYRNRCWLRLLGQ